MSEAAEKPGMLVLADGRRLAFSEFGDPAGVPVFYCHGFPGSRLEAGLAAAEAGSLGIRLIAADRPGFGRSDFQPGRRLSDWPADLLALADHLAVGRFAVLGVSGGAPYALACAQHCGERLSAVALVCGLGELAEPGATRGMSPAAAGAIALARRAPPLASGFIGHVGGPLLAAFPCTVFAALTRRAPAADRALLAEPAFATPLFASVHEAFRQGARGAAWEAGLFLRPWDIEPSRIAVPVQLWHGEADGTLPVQMGHRLAARIPRCEARFIAGEGHFSLPARHLAEILARLLSAIA